MRSDGCLCLSPGSIVLLAGHVTKSGEVAGPRVLEHMVDTGQVEGVLSICYCTAGIIVERERVREIGS